MTTRLGRPFTVGKAPPLRLREALGSQASSSTRFHRGSGRVFSPQRFVNSAAKSVQRKSRTNKSNISRFRVHTYSVDQIRGCRRPRCSYAFPLFAHSERSSRRTRLRRNKFSAFIFVHACGFSWHARGLARILLASFHQTWWTRKLAFGVCWRRHRAIYRGHRAQFEVLQGVSLTTRAMKAKRCC